MLGFTQARQTLRKADHSESDCGSVRRWWWKQALRSTLLEGTIFCSIILIFLVSVRCCELLPPTRK